MSNNVVNILYVHYGESEIRGSEICLLNILSRIDKTKFKPLLWCNSPVLAQRVEALGVEVILGDFSLLLGWQAPKFNVLQFIKLIKTANEILNTRQIDLVHCNSAAPCQWMSWATHFCKVKLVTHLHAPYPLRDRITLGTYRAHKIVSVNKQIRKQFKRDGVAEAQLAVIENGIDIDALEQHQPTSLRAHFNLAKDDVVLATVNYLNHSKGVDNCIDMLFYLKSEFNVLAHLVIIGDGPLKHELQAKAVALNVGTHVHFLGSVECVQPYLLSGLDVYVCGSREESFGLAIAEAAIANLPIVAPNVGGIPMIVKHNLTGLLYPPKDNRAFANGVYKLIENPTFAYKLSVLANKHVKDHFDIQTHVNKFMTCYLDTLASHYEPRLIISFNSIFRVASIAVARVTQRITTFFSDVKKLKGARNG